MKDHKQALAMAYAIRRNAMKKKAEASSNEKLDPEMEPEHSAEDIVIEVEREPKKKMADGGMVYASKENTEPSKQTPMELGMSSDPRSMAGKIMSKRMMAKGGMVKSDEDLSVDENDHLDRDVFLTADMPEEDMGNEHGFSDEDEQMAPPERRKKMLHGIMSGLSKRHFGK